MAKKKAAKKTTKKNLEMVLVASKTKELLKGSGKDTLNVSADALEKFNRVVHHMADIARERCKANGRKTVRPCDF
jgi:histone H3/H4